MSILGSQWGSGDSSCQHPCRKATGQRGPQGTQKMQGSPGSETPELCVPGLDAVPGQDGLGEELAQPWPSAA